MRNFLVLIKENPGLRDCLVQSISKLKPKHYAFGVGNIAGNGLMVGFTTIANKGRGAISMKRVKRGAGVGYSLASKVGNISHYIRRYGDPTPEQFAQLLTFGKVITPDISCSCKVE